MISSRYFECASINAVLENHKQELKKKLTALLDYRTNISSCPCALIMLRALIIVNITPSLKYND